MQITTQPMKKILSLISLSFIVGTVVHGCGAPPTVSEPATVAQTSLPLEAGTPASTATYSETEPIATVSVLPGLEVVYLRDGDLWSWTEKSGNVLLTNTGDLSAIRLSKSGKLLAFMRGREVWTVHMDGTDPRLLVTENKERGALWFSPSGRRLAVSTTDHVDVIDLSDGSTKVALSYSFVPNNFFPEVIWSVDETGFKTVIPQNSETGQAEFLFVFINGTVASLAKFSITPLLESLPFISPDGGYVIYTTKLNNGKKTLHLMDSSGATKPYGEPAGYIRALGWLPDAKHFLYAWGPNQQMLLGDVTEDSPKAISVTGYMSIHWLDAEHFLAIQGDNLYLGNINGEKSLIAEGVSDFDFGK
jgi:dipeptidyl aminopeptidase/acylaminoacyl peptidase